MGSLFFPDKHTVKMTMIETNLIFLYMIVPERVLCCAAEALHHALQQQTSLTKSSCTTELLTDPKPAADLAGLVPLPSGPAQAGPVPARALSPSLVMSSRGTALLVVSVQLKTGYLRLAAGCGAAQDQDLLQRLKQVYKPPS